MSESPKKSKAKKGSRPWRAPLAILGLALLWLVTPADSDFKKSSTWQKLVNPGPLSAAHAALEDRCAACHTAVAGVRPAQCISCHANDQTLLRSQPTAFHANVDSCSECHQEHQGRDQGATRMDHMALTALGLRQLNVDDPKSEKQRLRQELELWAAQSSQESFPNPEVRPEEAILNCITCHSNEDPHVGFFGDSCATCHVVDAWNIPEYQHPLDSSTDCAQCHKAPPSHLMPMFQSMCAKMLGKKISSINQCYVCHEVSAWNDMKGAAWHKKSMSHIPSR